MTMLFPVFKNKYFLYPALTPVFRVWLIYNIGRTLRSVISILCRLVGDVEYEMYKRNDFRRLTVY